MKVIVKDNFLNVRTGKASVNAPCYQYIAPGSEIEVDGQLYKGDLFDGIDTWMKDAAGNYYWSGGVHHGVNISEILKQSESKSDQQTSFKWFDQLGIKKVWEKYNEKGNSVTIAILDTGYDTGNQDIAGAVSEEKIIIDSDKYPGIDLVIDDQSNERHGNRCASLIGARNEMKWLLGIAPKCKLILGKISINREIRKFDYLLNGIEWAIDKGADIISISYAVEFTSQEALLQKGKFDKLLEGKSVMIFAGAGNSDGATVIGERYPASFPACISVGATDENMNLAALTVLSPKTILHAPGINVESFGLKDTPDPASGTSFSTPIVAAIAGLAISYLRAKGSKIDTVDMLAKLINTADPIQGETNKKIVNIEKLFLQL